MFSEQQGETDSHGSQYFLSGGRDDSAQKPKHVQDPLTGLLALKRPEDRPMGGSHPSLSPGGPRREDLRPARLEGEMEKR